MNLEEALKEIKRLKNLNQKLENVVKKQSQTIYELNVKLNKVLEDKENLKEKKRIIEVSRFVEKNEKIANIINETEDTLLKNKRKRGIKQGSKKHASFNFEKHVTDIIYEEPDIKFCEECNSELVLASEKVRYIIESIPSTLKVTKVIKRSYKCPVCNRKNNKIYYPISNNVFPGTILSPSFASYILYHKFELGIPFNHLERHIQSTLHVDISKQSLADYSKKCAILLTPLYDRMKKDLLENESKVIHSDETTLVVSKDPNKDDERKKSYVYVYASSYFDEKQIYLYSFHETREITKTAERLTNFNGSIVCDDFAGYTKLKNQNPNISLQRCMAHCRRRFSDILKALPQDKRKETLSYKFLELFEKVFCFEKKYKKRKLPIDKIVENRKKDIIPIKNKLFHLINKNNAKVNSPVEKAINYVKSVWDDLWTFIDNGYLEPSNNTAERAVKPFVIQRKVFQTAGSFAGAKFTTILFSIIQTCRINDINVERYLEYVINNIHNLSIEDLLPYSLNIKKVFKNK